MREKIKDLKERVIDLFANSKKKTVLMPLSADPIQNGHIDIITRASKKYGHVKVGILENASKKGGYLFSEDEKLELARKSLEGLANVEVISFKGLAVDYAYEYIIDDIVKGIRDEKDKELEEQLKIVGDSQVPGIKTRYFKAKKELAHISSTNVKLIQMAQGFTHKYVPMHVKQAVEARVSSQYSIGLTGEVAAGKSYITRKLVEIGEKRGIPVHDIDLDKIGHDILGALKEPKYQAIRERIADEFGQEVKNPDGTINRKALGEIVFNDKGKLKQLDEIMELPMEVRVRRELLNQKGLMIFNAALIAEADRGYMCNNNTILLHADKESQERRMKERGLTPEQIERRIASQFNFEQKKSILEKEIEKHSHGQTWVLENSDGSDPMNAEKVFDDMIKKIDIYGELRFMGLWNRIGADGKYDDVYARLKDELLKPHRHYHSLQHVVSMLNDYYDIRHELQDADAVEFSIWTHDMVYAEKSRVNEEKSAEFAKRLCKEALLCDEFSQKVYDLNMVTKHNIAPKSIDEKFMIDLDLAIFGKDEKAYDEYERNIQKEYEYVEPAVFRKRRIEILQGFLDKAERGELYYTEHFKVKYEARAKENLSRAIKSLSR